VLHSPFGAVFWCRYMPILIFTNQGQKINKARTVLGCYRRVYDSKILKTPWCWMMLHDLHVTSCDIQVCRLQELKLCDKSKPGCSVVRPVEAALEGQFASGQWQSTTSSPGIMFVFQSFGYRSPIGHNKSSKNIQQPHFATPNCKPSLRLSKENTSTKEPSLKRKWVYEVEEFHIYTFHAPNASCTVWLLLPLIQLELWLIVVDSILLAKNKCGEQDTAELFGTAVWMKEI